MEGKTPDQGATSQGAPSQGWVLEGGANPIAPGAALDGQDGQHNHAEPLDQGAPNQELDDRELSDRDLTHQGLADLGMDWLQDMAGRPHLAGGQP